MERIEKSIAGLNVTLIKTTKFKTVDFLLNFRNRLNPENVTKRALLPQVLKAATVSYPSKMEISRKLESLYGASLGSAVNKQGLLHIISFRMSIINDAYLMEDVNLLEESFKFFHEIIFEPKLENSSFLPKVVNEEKRLLKDQFLAIYDDKIRYSYHKLIDNMCEDELYRLKPIGRMEDLDNLDPKNLYEEYQKMLKEDNVDFLIIGDFDETKVFSLIEKYFIFNKRESIKEIVDRETKDVREVKRVVEVKDVSQAKLNIGFRTNITGIDDDYYPLLVLNGLLGVYPHSLLFRNVREKESLCYYISSTIDKGKGIMVIFAGIDKADYQKAYELSVKQLEMIKNGEFTEQDLDNTKKAYINDILQISDNPVDYLLAEYSGYLYDEPFDVDKQIKKVNAVTKESILNVAKKIQEDTVFLLTNEEVK